MKVKVINKNINQQFDCEEVEIDGYKYYIDYFQPIEVGKWYISNQSPRLCVKIKEGKYPYIHLNNKGEEIADFYTWKGVIICSNNPNINIPKVVNEIERLTFQEFKDWSFGEHDPWHTYKMFQKGYSKSQETHPNSDEDTIEFGQWVSRNDWVYLPSKKYWVNEEQEELEQKLSSKELFQLWKEQQPNVIYYE